MGIALPQLAPASEDRVSGAQVIDGSLKFDHENSQYLKRTPSNAGDRNVWTWSAWVKKSNATEQFCMFSAYGSGSNAGYGMLWFQNDGTLYFHNWDGQNNSAQTNAKFRNTGWYHIVAVHNEAHSTKMRFYVNGTLQTLAYNLTTDTAVNSAIEHRIGMEAYQSRKPYEGNMSQVYLIDGLELGPEHFGYTDPLTDVWRPKKYSFSRKSLNAGVQTWDSYFTTSGSWTDASKLFDTSGYGSGGETYVRDGANSNPALDVTIPVSSVGSTPQEVTIAAKMYLDSYAGANPNSSTNGFVRVIATIDGTDVTKEYTDSTAPNSAGTFNGRYYQDFGSFGTGVVSRVRITTQAAWFHVAGLEVNGTVLQNSINGDNTFHLPFDGNSPIGEDRAPSPNNGTVWSSNLTGTANGSGLITEMFDGNLSSGSWSDSSGYTITFPNGGVTASNNIKLYGGSGSANWYAVINGTKTTINAPGGSSPAWSATGVSGYVDLGSGTLTSIGTEGAGISQNGEVSGVSIDGTILIDSQIGNSFTPVNFGGSTALDKATGARPILNTVNGGTKAAPGVFGSEESAFYKTTSASNTGGQYYFSHDSSAKPTFSFVRGATYTFDWSASSGHPLRFATAADAAGSTEYTDGTNVSGNVTKITVPHNAPDTLYYYCNVHNGMGNSISVTTDETKADPYAWKNVLAMPLLGTKDDVSASINATSTTKATAITGNAASSDDSSLFYGGSFIFDGNSDYIEATPTAGSTLADGQGPYTIEFFFNIDSARMSDNVYNIMWSTSSGLTIAKWRSGLNNKVYFESDGSATGWNIQSQESIVANKWYHFAAVRDGTSVKVFLDGVLQGTATASYTASAETWWRVGGQSSNTSTHDGYIQDFRIYKGVAKYTSNFIPPSTNPDILRDSPSGAAFKSQLTTITDGATAFDGSGDYLRVEHGDMAMGTGDFSVEAFIYNNSHTNYRNYIGTRESGQAINEGWCIASNSGGALYVYSNGLYTNLTTQMAEERWYHVVYTRASGTHRWIVNGVLRGTDSSSRDYTDDKLTIGANSYAGSEPLDGFVSNVRVIKGSIPTEYQTSSTTTGEIIFIPPAGPLTTTSQGATANDVKLLCCQSNTFAGAAAASPNLGGVNDGTQWSGDITPGSKFRSGYGPANAFDGNSVSSISGTTACEINEVSFVEFNFGDGIPFTTLQMQCDDNNEGTVILTGANGDVDITSQLPTGSFTNTTITGVTSPLTKLRMNAVNANSSSVYLGSITIDGTMLKDPISPYGDASATTFNPLSNNINTILGQEGVYAVMNPLGKGSNVTLSKNNLRAVSGSSGNDKRAGYCNMAVPASGSYYCEATIGATNGMVGIINADYFRLDNIPGCSPNSYAYYENGNKYLGDCNAISYGAAFTTGDVISMGIDRGTLTFYKNGVSQGPAMENLTGRYFFGFGSYNNTIDFNFGQKPFKFAPPSGHQPITSTTIRETSLEPRPNKYCAPVIWTGSSLNVNQSRTITTERADFIPDLVWVKTRTGGNEPPALYDSVRGDGTGNKRLLTDRANAESTFSSGVSADLSGFVKGGFTVNGTNGHINGGASYTHAGWMWKAGGKHNTFNIDDVGYANASDVNMSVGSLNSTMLKQDANYANASNFSGDTGGLTFTRMFNGTMGSGDVDATVCLFSPYGNSTSTTWTAPTTINNITKLRIYVDMSGTASGGDFQVNGIDYRDHLDSAIYGQITSGEDGWVTIPETHLSTIKFGRNSNNTIAVGICAVEVNDQILIDNQITAPNFPSIANDGCSVGTKNGFSIVTFTGNGSAAQLAHGLGDYPDFILHKFRTASSNWSAWSPFLNNNTRVIWNDNDGMASSSSFNQNTKHTFYVHSGHNDNTVKMIAYCWRNIPGVQKFGQYKGTGSDLGAYIDCGFKPAIVITKAYSTNSNNNNDWIIKDTARDTYNPTTKNLLLNKTDQELSNASHTSIDITENGFKLYNDDSGYSNYSGGAGTWDYIYMAFAEQPAFNLYGALSNSR